LWNFASASGAPLEKTFASRGHWGVFESSHVGRRTLNAQPPQVKPPNATPRVLVKNPTGQNQSTPNGGFVLRFPQFQRQYGVQSKMKRPRVSEISWKTPATCHLSCTQIHYNRVDVFTVTPPEVHRTSFSDQGPVVVPTTTVVLVGRRGAVLLPPLVAAMPARVSSSSSGSGSYTSTTAMLILVRDGC
jgi:hypothetical protein